MSIARKGAEEAGRNPDALRPIICAPVYVSDDMAEAREQVRWFPAMVSNHVMDLLNRYDESELPPALFEYVKRREFYDYKDHSRVGAAHGEFVDDETCERFCILGTTEQHIEKLKALEAVGVDQCNVYLMTHGEERTLDPLRRARHSGVPVAKFQGSLGETRGQCLQTVYLVQVTMAREPLI